MRKGHRLCCVAASLLGFCILLSGKSLFAAEPGLKHRVENLDYGQALYEYFQNNELGAITTLLVSKDKPSSAHQRDESDLLLADLYYGYGLYAESDQLFTRLLNDETSRSLKNRIWFNLARLHHAQGYFENARDLLQRTDEQLPENLHDEKNYLLSSLYLQDQQFDLARQAREAINTESEWSIYASYNLGINRLEADDFDQGMSWLQPLTTLEVDNAESSALLDQINLTLALSHLRRSQPDLALESFQRIRLQGPLSNTALLGAGWAWDKLGQYEKALVPWVELATNNRIDAATQEALLAIPTVLEKNGKPKLALQYYQLAADKFDTQDKTLNKIAENIRSGELVQLLEGDAAGGRNKPTRLSLQTETASYLYSLLASNDFQRSAKTYQDLIDIRRQLKHWQFNLPTLELMLNERQARFLQKRPLLEQSSSLDNLVNYQQQRDRLATQLDHIEQKNDYRSLATEEEKELLSTLDNVSQRIQTIGDQRNTENQQDMYRLLSGLLDWEISTDYQPRLWRARKQLLALDRALLISNQRSLSIGQITQKNKTQYDAFQRRIEGQSEKLNRLGDRVNTLLKRQATRINQMAISAIAEQQQHLQQLRLNSRYAVAKLYDKLTGEQQ